MLNWDFHMSRTTAASMLPAIAITAGVALGPLLVLAWQSSRDLNYFEGRSNFVGFDNARRLLGDEAFLASVDVTLRYAVWAALLSTASALVIAVALYNSTWARCLAPVLCTPFLLAPVVTAVLFMLLLDGQLGTFPVLLRWLGFDDPENITGDPRRVFWALVGIDTWQWAGVLALILWARLNRIPRGQLELVSTCGGNAWMRLRDVWFPMLWPVLLAVLVFKFTWALGDSERIDVLTAGGGPYGAMRVFPIWLDREYFRYGDYGYGAAASLFFLLVAITAIGVFQLILRRVGRR